VPAIRWAGNGTLVRGGPGFEPEESAFLGQLTGVKVSSSSACTPLWATVPAGSSMQSLPATATADSYFEIGFPAALGSLAAGVTVQVELGFHDPTFSRDLTQTNDYSYGANASGTQMEWDACPGPSCDARFTSCSIALGDMIVRALPAMASLCWDRFAS